VEKTGACQRVVGSCQRSSGDQPRQHENTKKTPCCFALSCFRGDHRWMVPQTDSDSKSLSINGLVGLIYVFGTMPNVIDPRIVRREEHSVSRRDIDPDALK